jgi:hypothetical protein
VQWKKVLSQNLMCQGIEFHVVLLRRVIEFCVCESSRFVSGACSVFIPENIRRVRNAVRQDQSYSAVQHLLALKFQMTIQ